MQGAQVRSLVRELRSRKPCGVGKKKKKKKIQIPLHGGWKLKLSNPWVLAQGHLATTMETCSPLIHPVSEIHEEKSKSPGHCHFPGKQSRKI